MSLDDRLQAIRDHRVDADVDAALTAILARDRARQVRRFAAAGVLGLVVLVGGVLLASTRNEQVPDRGVVAGLPPSGPAPDEVAAGPVDLVLHADQMAKGDRWLAAFVVNSGSEAVTDHYLDIVIERWNGTAWVTTGERTVRSCDDVLCVSAPTVEGGLGLLKTEVELAPGDELGPLWIDLADQDFGEYRLVAGVGGTTLTTARIDIVEDASGLLPLDQRRDRLVFEDSLTEPTAETPSIATVLGAGEASAAELAEEATFERWTGTDFVRVGRIERSTIPFTDGTERDGYVLPTFRPGAYRLATALSGEPIHGWVFVRDLDGAVAPIGDKGTSIGPGAVGLAPAPVTVRPGAEPAVVDGRLVVWGGATDGTPREMVDEQFASFDEGAVFDLRLNSWQLMPPAPLDPDRRAPVSVARADGEVVVFSGGRVAAYTVARDSWTALPDTDGIVLEAFEVDDALFAVTDADELVALDGDRWTAVAGSPSLEGQSEQRQLVSTGDELVVLRRAGTVVAGRAYDPTSQSWRSLPTVSVESHAEQAAAAHWTGTEIVWVGYQMSVVAYDPATDRWRQRPSLPIDFLEGVPEVVSHRGTTVVSRAGVFAVDAGDHWVTLPADPWLDVGADVETSLGLVGFGYGDMGQVPVAIDVEELVSSSNRIQIGSYVVELGADEQVTDSALERTGGFGSGVTVELSGPSGGCTLTTTLQGDAVSPRLEPTEITPGVVELRRGQGIPSLTVTCAATPTAMRLAETATHSP